MTCFEEVATRDLRLFKLEGSTGWYRQFLSQLLLREA